MRHHDPARLVKDQVTSPRQFLQARSDCGNISAEVPAELTDLRCTPRLREHAIHRDAISIARATGRAVFPVRFQLV